MSILKRIAAAEIGDTTEITKSGETPRSFRLRIEANENLEDKIRNESIVREELGFFFTHRRSEEREESRERERRRREPKPQRAWLPRLLKAEGSPPGKRATSASSEIQRLLLPRDQ